MWIAMPTHKRFRSSSLSIRDDEDDEDDDDKGEEERDLSACASNTFKGKLVNVIL